MAANKSYKCTDYCRSAHCVLFGLVFVRHSAERSITKKQKWNLKEKIETQCPVSRDTPRLTSLRRLANRKGKSQPNCGEYICLYVLWGGTTVL